jgi:BirA family biotin operon repressor/biotin-[acetyl-CoA-carboxylase] ligase
VPPFDFDDYMPLLRAERIGRTVRYFEETTSTMDEARAGADRGDSSDGAAYIAGLQTAGRGRQGRQWVSEPGAGLYVTYHLVAPADATASSLSAVAGGMAAADAVEATAGLETQLKWPNDLLLGGRKLAGILAEARFGERVDVFLGIGINVRASVLPPELRDIATSIEGAGGAVPRIEALLAALSGALEGRLRQLEDAPAALVDDWRARLVTMGQRVRLASPDGRVYEGEAIDVSPAGDLVLRHEDGSIAEYSAGDVTTA